MKVDCGPRVLPDSDRPEYVALSVPRTVVMVRLLLEVDATMPLTISARRNER